MAGLRRTIKRYTRSKSLQPVWFGIIVIVLLLYHAVFDVRKLFLIQNSKITINVAKYNLRNGDRHSPETLELLKQVENGEKPIFVIEDDMLRAARESAKSQTSVPNRTNFGAGISWKTDRSRYRRVHEFRNFAQLPHFSDAVCREELGRRIPNTVHYIWFGRLQMTFLQYLSVRSAAAVQKASLIILHTDSGEPVGKYWNSLRQEIPCLEVRYLAKPVSIFEKYPLKTLQQKSHVSRIKLLFHEGGIYSNLNVIFTKSFDSLMDYSLVLGKEEVQYYSNSVILADKGAPFLAMWFKAYNRRVVDWSTYSIFIPWKLHQENPTTEIHIEDYSMMRPNFKEDDWITDKNWVLDDNFCVHLYTSRDRIKSLVSSPPLDIINMDNTFGQLARIALFGKPYLDDKVRDFRARMHLPLNCSKQEESQQEEIPNIVHYIMQNEKFTYKHYLSVRSAARVLKPYNIFIHLQSDVVPDNLYWIRLQKDINCVKINHLADNGPRALGDLKGSESFGKLIYHILNKYGGIYLDFDVVITNPFTDLFQNSVVMGMNAAHGGSIDVLMAVKKSEFLSEWFSWQKNDINTVKDSRDRYIYNGTEFVEILEDFPVMSVTGGWKSINFDYREIRCFVVTDRDTEVNLDDVIEDEVLRSDSLSGQIARIAQFGSDEILD